MKKTNIISKLEKNEFLDFESFIRSVDDTRECFIPCESVIYDEAEVININDFFRGGEKKYIMDV